MTAKLSGQYKILKRFNLLPPGFLFQVCELCIGKGLQMVCSYIIIFPSIMSQLLRLSKKVTNSHKLLLAVLQVMQPPVFASVLWTDSVLNDPYSK